MYTTQKDELFIRNRSYNLHLQRLSQIKRQVDIPLSTPHYHSNFSVYKQRVNSLAQKRIHSDISKHNHHLYEKIFCITSRSPSNLLDSANDSAYDCFSNYTTRKHFATKINSENERFLQRIRNQKPTLRLQALEKDYQQLSKIKNRLTKIKNQADYIQKLKNHSEEKHHRHSNNASLQ